MSAASKRGKRLREWLITGGLVLAVMIGMRAWQTRDAVKGDAPALEGRGLLGEPVSLASLRAEGPVLVHFWASWCSVCDAMEHNVRAVAEEARVVTVASGSGGSAELLEWLRERGELGAGGGSAYPIIADPSARLAARWGVSAFPTSFVVAEDGTIRFVEVGYSTELGLRLRLWWAR
ncbi:MAG: redoxin domain-containing protein [Myxococcales bacterium]|nr:redoxin domain-containing protein [Myxococcales bacterium]